MNDEKISQLGQVQKVFTFKPEADRRFLAGTGLSVMALYGLYLGMKDVVVGEGPLDILVTGASFFLLLGSLTILRHGFLMKSNKVRLFERGFDVEIVEQEHPFAWDHITHVTEIVKCRWGTTQWQILVERNDGESFAFVNYELDGADELRDAMQQATAARGVPWETKTAS